MKNEIVFCEAPDQIIQTRMEGGIIYGQVYSGYFYGENLTYLSKVDGSAVSGPSLARCYFNFSYRWRGVWEGRIYFKDEEYWDEELKEMADLWELIKEHCKISIKAAFPGNHYDE